MRSRFAALPVVVFVAAVLPIALWRPARADAPQAPRTDAAAQALIDRLPTAFVPNLGQWQHAARFVARFGAVSAFLADRQWTIVAQTESRGVALRFEFVGAAASSELVPEQRLSGLQHYLVGDDQSRWRRNVPRFASVVHRGLYPGVDVRVRESTAHLEYDLMLEPSADLSRVEIAVDGAQRLRLAESGALVVETSLGDVTQPEPSTWEVGPDGEKRALVCRYELRGANRFGFAVPGRTDDLALVVDPGLVWSTLLGGANQDAAHGIALDANGAATIVGQTTSPTFPVTLGAFDTSLGGTADAFVTQLSSDGLGLVYSTYLGGTDAGDEDALAVALGASGDATVAGWTFSLDFPTTAGAFDRTSNGNGDGFVARLSPSGSSLEYSTLLGGNTSDAISAVAVDVSGAATVAGGTSSADFPTTLGAFDQSYGGGAVLFGLGDAFVARLTPTGSNLVYSTFLGGSGQDGGGQFNNPSPNIGVGMALDSSGAATVVGGTDSVDFPTTAGVFDTTFNGGGIFGQPGDVFVARLSPSGSSLVYSTYLGGANAERAYAVAIDSTGAASVGGWTTSPTFPTTPGAFDTNYSGGGCDGFVARLSASGTTLEYSTFFGGISDEQVTALTVDSSRAVTIAGLTLSVDFPATPGAFDTTYGGGGARDAFVARLSPSGASVTYSTFLGGTGDDEAAGVALDANGAATVIGSTNGTDYPTTPGAFDPTANGATDPFVTRLDLLPVGVRTYGASTPGCTGPLAIGVTALPQVGNAAFSITCNNAPPSSGGCILFGAAAAEAMPFAGVRLWVDPFGAWLAVSLLQSNTVGAVDCAMPIPANPLLVGGRFAAQFFWASPTSPGPCPTLGLSASNAIQIEIQA